MDAGQTPVQSIWSSTLYIKLDPNTDCLPSENKLEIAPSNIKKQLHLGTPQGLFMDTLYARVSLEVVNLKVLPHPSSGCNFSLCSRQDYDEMSKNSNSKIGML